MKQETFFALYDYPYQIERGEMALDYAVQLTRQTAYKRARELRGEGYKVKLSSSMQTRESWGLGRPCGLTCKAWILNAF